MTSPTDLVPKPFPSLPIEIITMIMYQLARSDHQVTLATCCRVSKSLYNIASPMVWRHLHIKPGYATWYQSSLKAGTRSRKVNIKRRVRTEEEQVEVQLGDEESKTMLREIVRADLKKENDIRALFRSIVKTRPEVLDDVRIFTIHHHQPGRCQALGVPFQLNNLHTLRIDATSHSRSEPAPTAFTWWRVAPWQERQCKYMKHLEPKSLVLRNATLAKINFISFGLSTKVAETIEELVMISDLSESTDKKHDCIGPCRITSMPKLRRFMWIFRPSNDGAEFCSDITYPTGQHSMPHICALFSVIIELKEVEFIFVNTGEIRHHVSDSAWWTKTGDEFQKEVENYWRTKIDLTGRKKGWTKRDLEEKHELVRFCSLEDWMDEVGSGWRDVLSEKEVGEWSEK